MIDSDVLRALLATPKAGGRLYGVVIGIVTNNQDPDNMHRVKVRFPWLSAEQADESNWARVVTPMAGKDRGLYYLPEVDDEVLVAFEHGSVDHPFVIGALWNGKDTPPESNQDKQNNCRTIKSRSGHVVRLNDKQGGEAIEIIDKSGNKIVIRSTDNTLTIEAQGDIAIKSGSGKLAMTAPAGIEIQSQTSIKIKAGTTMDVSATGPMTVKGALIKLN